MLCSQKSHAGLGNPCKTQENASFTYVPHAAATNMTAITPRCNQLTCAQHVYHEKPRYFLVKNPMLSKQSKTRCVYY
jgi:hypothetical protein